MNRLRYKKWEAEWTSSKGGARPVEIWMQQRIHNMELDLTDADDSDTLLLSNPPSMTCQHYAKMTVYGNHWRFVDDFSRAVTTYDSGVACLEANEQSAGLGKNYVAELTDIFC